VKWTDFAENTWEPRSNLTCCDLLIKEFKELRTRSIEKIVGEGTKRGRRYYTVIRKGSAKKYQIRPKLAWGKIGELVKRYYRKDKAEDLYKIFKEEKFHYDFKWRG
jgi:hypothetical protein